MREIRQSGSEGGVARKRHPYPYRSGCAFGASLFSAKKIKKKSGGSPVKASADFNDLAF